MERDKELVTDYLLISRFGDPPTPAKVVKTLNEAGLGFTNYTPEPIPAPNPDAPPPRRVKVGAYTLTAPSGIAKARIIVARYSLPAVDGLTEQTFNQLTRNLGPNDARTVKVGSLALDTRITGGFGAPVETQRWALSLLSALIGITEGAVIDPHAQSAFGADRVSALALRGPRAQISVHNEAWSGDRRWLHTHGLEKFGRPDLDFMDIPAALENEAQALLLDIAENLAQGEQLSAGQEISLDELGNLVALPYTPDAEHQTPWGRLRLCDVPVPPQRQTNSARQTLARVALADADNLRASGDPTRALELIERILAADSDDSLAMALKARILLDDGRPHDALELGELMQLRAPTSYQGSLVSGLALLALGRNHEALNALNHAIEIEPEAAQAYSARSEAYTRLGDQRLAMVDRARAAYLRG